LKPVLEAFREWDIALVEARHFEKYQAQRLSTGLSPATINTEVRTALKVLRWCEREGYLEKAPAVEQIPEQSFRETVIPTEAEMLRIIDELPPTLRPLFLLIVETGMRWSEATHLTWNNVDEVGGWVRVTADGGFTPKTRHSERKLAIGSAVLSVLRSLPKTSVYVFPGRNNKPISNARKALATAVRKANITRDGRLIRITPHVLRKCYTTWQQEKGVPESVIQSNLGHAPGSQVTRRNYTITTDEAKRAYVFELGEAARKSPGSEDLAKTGNRNKRTPRRSR
jgi:integrase